LLFEAFKSLTGKRVGPSRREVPNVRTGVKGFSRKHTRWSVNHKPKLAFCAVREKLFEQAQELVTDQIAQEENYGNRTLLGERQSFRLAGNADIGSEGAGV
jgi:hypothetical protein